MRYHIDTIPIWDAFKEEGECPLCSIYQKCETEFVTSALGGSVMESDTRIQVNKTGFCRHHLRMLWDQQNRLGLALMMHSRLKELLADLENQQGDLLAKIEQDEKKGLLERAAKTMSKSLESTQQAKDLAQTVKGKTQTCFICDRLDTAMDRYGQTVLALWENDAEFAKLFSIGKGFCLEHYSQLLSLAAQHMSGKKQRSFLRALMQLEQENLRRIEQELEWYTLKFDYRNKDKPWGESRDAVERTLFKLRSWRKP